MQSLFHVVGNNNFKKQQFASSGTLIMNVLVVDYVKPATF